MKWKRVDGNKVKLSDNEVEDVVIVDLKTGKAMSNDKGDKDPAAVAVTLNDDLDRIIMEEVPENVQWKCNKGSALNITVLTFKTEDGQNLYAETSDKVLKVGNVEDSKKLFTLSISGKSLSTFGDNSYRCYSDDSMFSNIWKLGDSSDENAQNAQIAIFKKVEDPQKIVKIELPEYYNYDLKDKDQYTLYERDFNEKVTITGAEKTDINWSSSKSATESESAVDINQQGTVTLNKRGTTVITASVDETLDHDKASAKCTVIVDDSGTADPGTVNLPLTVAEAKELAETGELKHEGITVLTLKEGVHYYIKGKVSKVNSGMMAMFGDMDFGEMMGGSGSSSFNFEDSMDDMDFDPEDMEESGFDMSSMGFDMSSLGFDMSAMFGTSDKVTYYISDDGTKDGQMKVINGCGTLKSSTGGTMEFNQIPKLSPGDCVVVCGPLVKTEDKDMFSSLMGGSSSEPKYSGKVDEMNYLAVYDPTLIAENKEIYVNKSLKVTDGVYNEYTLDKGIYSIDNLFNQYDGYRDEVKITDINQIKEATIKSSDGEIVKWDEDKKELIGVKEGKAKITVKVKVVLQEADDQADPKVEEKSYTMKRKFKVIVKTRDLLPAGYYDGEWVLTENTDDLKEGTRLVLVGTRVKEDKETTEKTYTDYIMAQNNAMMGGGKNGSKIEIGGDKTKIPSDDIKSKKGLEVVLEKDKNDDNFWMLNVGEDENGNKLYLYASDSSKNTSTEDNPTTENDPTTEDEDKPKFDVSALLEMFMPSSGLKVGTMDKVTADSLKATISIDNKIATIKYDKISRKDDKSIIMLSSSFDMGEMMNMFGGNNEQGGGNNEQGGGSSTGTGSFNMDSFDMFMASFNTKKPGDENAEEGKDPKCFMPRIYRFVPDPSYKTEIGSTEWKTIVSYKDVQVPNGIEAYIVTGVKEQNNQSLAILSPVINKELAGGAPYLLHISQPDVFEKDLESGNYIIGMTLLTPNDPDQLEAPEGNLLKKSDRKTSGEDATSTVYVLAKKSLGVGFYKWIGGELGAGRVYLTGKAHENPNTTNAHEFVGFFVDETGEATAIESIDDFKANVGPFYDLQGRRVDNPTKGIYIVNGKKIVIK